MLEAGIKAPEFKLQDKDGNLVSLSDFKNKKIVVCLCFIKLNYYFVIIVLRKWLIALRSALKLI